MGFGSVLQMRRGTMLLGLIFVWALSACSPTYRSHGYVPTDDELANIIVGSDTRGSVEEVIGSPSSTGVLTDGGWYYLASRVKNYTYHKPKVISREMVAISFDASDVVTNVERFGLEDGRVIALNRRVTTSAVKNPGFLSQLLGSIGTFDPGTFLNGSN